VWTTAAPGARNASVDGNALKYAESTLLDFDVRIDCTAGSGECAADGDVIETVLRLSASSSSGRVSTQVTIKTTVVALVSCDNTEVRITQDERTIDGGVVPSGSALHVHVAAKDVDGLNVTTSPAELDLQWGGIPAELRWQRDDEHGSNEYVAVLPTDLDSATARRTLVIALLGGWSQSGGETSRCQLLELTVDLQEAPHSKLQYYVLGGSLVACAVVVGSRMRMMTAAKRCEKRHRVVSKEVGGGHKPLTSLGVVLRVARVQRDRLQV
jgi:hypothetical protein